MIVAARGALILLSLIGIASPVTVIEREWGKLVALASIKETECAVMGCADSYVYETSPKDYKLTTVNNCVIYRRAVFLDKERIPALANRRIDDLTAGYWASSAALIDVALHVRHCGTRLLFIRCKREQRGCVWGEISGRLSSGILITDIHSERSTGDWGAFYGSRDWTNPSACGSNCVFLSAPSSVPCGIRLDFCSPGLIERSFGLIFGGFRLVANRVVDFPHFYYLRDYSSGGDPQKNDRYDLPRSLAVILAAFLSAIGTALCVNGVNKSYELTGNRGLVYIFLGGVCFASVVWSPVQ